MSANPKLPIPRLERREYPSKKPAESAQKRVSRACLSCRTRKVRCNGAQPKCKNCEDNMTSCVYSSSRKDRLKIATEHNQSLLALLRDLHHRVGPADRAKIENALSNISDDVADAALATASADTSAQPPADNQHDEERGEANVSAEVGSNEDLDLIDEDLLRDEGSRSTGFIGKTSEVQWLRRLRFETDNAGGDSNARPDGPYGPPGDSAGAKAQRVNAMKMRHGKNPGPLAETSSLNFYLDDQKFDTDYLVDSWELPPFSTAEKLLNCYMTTVHDSFPIVAKSALVSRFYKYYASAGQEIPPKLPQRWQGMLNLVFAIGAAYSHLAEEPWRADERDHLVYHSRAWALTRQDPWWFSHPDLPQLQINGLMGFYYLAIGHVNRSWMVSGMAVRSAYALGLHLRNEDRAATAAKKETMRRIWWGVYSLESVLSSLTGRPSVAFDSHISIPLPLPLSTEDIDEAIIISRFGNPIRTSNYPQNQPEKLPAEISSDTSGRMKESIQSSNEPANAGSYLKAIVKISMITQRILAKLYAANVANKSWEHVQSMIAQLSEQLEVWASTLPAGFNLTANHRFAHSRERTILEFHYYSAKIVMTRPCLCRLNRRIEHQSQISHDFNRRTAEVCVQAAKAIAERLPDDMEVDRSQIYHIGPWWTMVHCIMQALTIIMLELSYNTAEDNEKRPRLLVPLRRLVGCLRAMSVSNTMARRAHRIAIELLKKMMTQIDVDIFDLISEETTSPMHTTPTRPEPHQQYHTPGVGDPSEGIRLPLSASAEMQTFQGQDTLANPNPFELSDEQLAFIGSGEFDSSTSSSSDYFVHSFPQNTSFTNLFMTVYDEHNPLPFVGGEFLDLDGYDQSLRMVPSEMLDQSQDQTSGQSQDRTSGQSQTQNQGQGSTQN